jgi:hypothetical protein
LLTCRSRRAAFIRAGLLKQAGVNRSRYTLALNVQECGPLRIIINSQEAYVKIFLAVCFSLVLFVVGLLGTFKVNLLVYGAEEFNGNAGAGFAVLMEGLCIGLLLALGGVVLSGGAGIQGLRDRH